MTREEIRIKINNLNKEKEQCKELKSSYSSSLSCLNKTMAHIGSAINQITQAHDNLKKYYNINGKAVCQDKINNLKSNISNVQKQLNIIGTEINKDINNSNNQINRIEREINALELEYKNAIE